MSSPPVSTVPPHSAATAATPPNLPQLFYGDTIRESSMQRNAQSSQSASPEKNDLNEAEKTDREIEAVRSLVRHGMHRRSV